MSVKEVSLFGRGGQGAVTSAQVIAIAAFYDGKHSQAFPNFGVERRGAPVQSYARISDKEIRVREHVYKPDYVIVLDPTLMLCEDVAQGTDRDSVILINSEKKASELGLKTDACVYTIDVTRKVMEEIGKPFVNLAILAFFAYASGEITIESLKKAVEERFEGKKGAAEMNFKAIDAVVEECEKSKEIKCQNVKK